MCFFVVMFIRLHGDKTAGILHAPMSKSIEAFAIASKISYIVILPDAGLSRQYFLSAIIYLVARYITEFTDSQENEVSKEENLTISMFYGRQENIDNESPLLSSRSKILKILTSNKTAAGIGNHCLVHRVEMVHLQFIF